MPQIRHTAVVNAPRDVTFAVVTDVADYPDFIDECSEARIVGQTENELTAELTLGWGSYHARFEQDPPESVSMHLVEGPLGRLEGHWRFQDLGGQRSGIDLTVAYQSSSFAKDLLLRPIIDRVCRRLVESVARKASR